MLLAIGSNSESSHTTLDFIIIITRHEEGDSERSDNDEQPDGKKSSLKKDGLEKKNFDKLEKSPEGEK